jgi:hypothetical protein
MANKKGGNFFYFFSKLLAIIYNSINPIIFNLMPNFMGQLLWLTKKDENFILQFFFYYWIFIYYIGFDTLDRGQK